MKYRYVFIYGAFGFITHGTGRIYWLYFIVATLKYDGLIKTLTYNFAAYYAMRLTLQRVQPRHVICKLRILYTTRTLVLRFAKCRYTTKCLRYGDSVQYTDMNFSVSCRRFAVGHCCALC